MPYPVSLNVKDRVCVIIGGGNVAARRAKKLIESGAKVRIVAPDINPALMPLAENGTVEWQRAVYNPGVIANTMLAIAATDSTETNEQVEHDARKLGVLVCRADSEKDGDFSVMASVERGDLNIAVSTNGTSPTLAAVIRQRIESQYGREWADWTELFGLLRLELQKRPDEGSRRSIVEQILADKMISELIAQGEIEKAKEGAGKYL